jgi:hypothetical protein
MNQTPNAVTPYTTPPMDLAVESSGLRKAFGDLVAVPTTAR